MPRLSALKAPLALALLFAASLGHAGGNAGPGEQTHEPGLGAAPRAQDWTGFSPLHAFLEQQIAAQVRIQQRVVVRISPQPMAVRQELAAQALERELVNRYEERKIGKCLPLESIAAVQTGGANRLVLFLRDQRMVSLSLEKGCRARDFYSGFYVERHKDGRLCIERDQLQSRSGATCEVERLSQLVEMRD
jgi:hypothetical protein